MQPLLTISINGERFDVRVEETFETNKDGRGGCLFVFGNGKKGFIRFEQFSFVIK